MQQITVSNLISLSSLAKDSQVIVPAPSPCFLQLSDSHIFIQSSGLLRIYSLLDQQLLYSLQCLMPRIKKVCLLGNLLGIISEGTPVLQVLDAIDGSCRELQGHMADLLDIRGCMGGFVTASRDYTVRVWELAGTGDSRRVKMPIALKGHKGAVNCLCSYGNMLISGSEDRTIVCWNNRQAWTASSEFESAVVAVLACPLSGQIVVVTRDSLAHFIRMDRIATKSVQVIAKLDLNLGSNLHLAEVDDSFMVVSGDRSVKFIEVNLFKQINEIPLDEQGCRGGVAFRGRCLFYGSGQGVSAVKI